MRSGYVFAIQKGPISRKLLGFRPLFRPIRGVCKKKIQNYDKNFLFFFLTALVRKNASSRSGYYLLWFPKFCRSAMFANANLPPDN
jgi:hypothetical protein